MSAAPVHKPIVHFVGSIPLSDAETVFRTLSAAAGPHLKRLPDGETGIRKTWIRFLQGVLADNTAYAEMAIQSWQLFDRLQQAGVIPAGVKFQISLPTPIAPTYNNMVPADRPGLLPALTRHFIDEVARIADALPNDRIAVQWDVCQEVLAWEGYYEAGPVEFRTETIGVLTEIGDAVPAGIELGYHLCYGSPADEHCVQPKDSGIMVEIVNRVTARVRRPIQFFHLPVPKPRRDDAYFAPLERLKLRPETELYLG